MAGAGQRSLRDSSFSSLRLACIAAVLLSSAAFSSAKPSTHKRTPLEAEAFKPTGPYLTHTAGMVSFWQPWFCMIIGKSIRMLMLHGLVSLRLTSSPYWKAQSPAVCMLHARGPGQ